MWTSIDDSFIGYGSTGQFVRVSQIAALENTETGATVILNSGATVEFDGTKARALMDLIQKEHAE